jgi:hypothetical protein
VMLRKDSAVPLALNKPLASALILVLTPVPAEGICAAKMERMLETDGALSAARAAATGADTDTCTAAPLPALLRDHGELTPPPPPPPPEPEATSL